MYFVEGFEFDSIEMANKAKKEADGIRYIRSQMKLDNPDVVLRLYNKLILKQMFETPVGYQFLSELQEYLKTSAMISDREIRPIPISSSYLGKEDKEAVKMRKDAHKYAKRMEKIREEFEERNHSQHQKNYRAAFRASMAACVICIFIIIGMFLITMISGNNTNIINYENAILDKYEKWEQELEQREAEVSRKEKQLQGI